MPKKKWEIIIHLNNSEYFYPHGSFANLEEAESACEQIGLYGFSYDWGKEKVYFPPHRIREIEIQKEK